MAKGANKQQETEYTRCFVASPSRPPELLTGLSEAIALANAKGELQYHLWTKNDIAGRDLVQPIQENIRNSTLFVADVTYLNLNVTYEVGYALGQSKRVLLSRYRGLKGDIDLANDIGIYDTLGRQEYDAFEQLGAFLASKHDLKPTSTDLLLYYAVIGVPEADGKAMYIYDTQYNMGLLKALSRKRTGNPMYRIHPAFWPALRITPPPAQNSEEPSLFATLAAEQRP